MGNRLNQFYNPSLYKAPAKTELSAESRIVSNMGNPDGIVTTTQPGGIANTGVTVFAQVSAHRQSGEVAPAPPPETWGAYAKKGEESTGVIAMIDLLIKDLDLTELKRTKLSTFKELQATVKYIASLHAECDWLMQFFDVRKEARNGEIKSLVDAKAVLSGADYALVQEDAHRSSLRGA